MNQLDMKGRHGVVTGGATGLGYAIAERMVVSGARVTLWDRDIGGMGRAGAGGEQGQGSGTGKRGAAVRRAEELGLLRRRHSVQLQADAVQIVIGDLGYCFGIVFHMINPFRLRARAWRLSAF